MRYAVAFVLGLSGMFGASAAVAEEHEIGEELYKRYRAGCHGETGGGGGDMQNFLDIEMPNLRTMAQRNEANEGVFPLLETIHIIDGRSGLRAHGGPMPIWGAAFMDEDMEDYGFYGSVLETRGRVLSLALYLESIQE